MMESSSRVDEKSTKQNEKKSTLAIPTRRGGSKSPLRKDQNENESSQTPLAANIQSRAPARVVSTKHTKSLRSKRVNSDSRAEEVTEQPKPGNEDPEEEIAEIESPPTQRDKQKESSTDTDIQRRLSEPNSPADSTSSEVVSELTKATRKTKNKFENKTPRTKVSERLRHKSSDNFDFFEDSIFDKENITKKCSVRLCHLDIDVKTILNMEDLKKSPSIAKESKDPQKRDSENYHNDGPVTKKQKNDDIIILEPENKALERISKPPTPDVTVIKVKSSSKEVTSSNNSPKEKKSSSNRSPSGESRKQNSSEKPTLQRAGSFESMRKGESNNQKSSKSSSSSSSTSTLDKTDRTSLQCLEQKLLDLQKATQKTKHTNDFHSSKPKSMSPSGLKPSKDPYHRRKEDFITERKKVNSSPIKKPLKKSVSLPAAKDSKMGNLFCPTTDAKVTILPINKPNPKDVDHKPPSTSNSVTITKLSSGDSLSVPAKDIKKVFTSKSDMKSEVKSKVSPVTIKNQTKFSVKNFSKTEKHRSSDKSEKVHRDKHRDKEYHSRDSSREGRERSRERRDHKENSKHTACSKCHEQFSTKEAKKLHTCNSILDAHYLIDGRDRQKTSPTSSASNSERSESTSASLSRSSSRSSSPGIPIVNNKKTCTETPKLKISMKSDKTDDKVGKVKISLKKDDCDEKLKDKDKKLDRYIPKRDSMKEKWVESKPSFKSEHHSDDPLTKDGDRTTSITIEALKVEHGDHGEKGDNQVKHTTSLEIVKLDGDIEKKEAKEELPLVHDRMEHASFAFSGKRTYSPSMSETTSVDGKESPRETNSKDSPASQADSGVFSIASSASPSKVDGVLNTDVRSPESPSRDRINCLDASAPLKPDVNQWKTSIALSSGTHGGIPESRLLTTTSSSTSASSFGFKGESSEPGLPQGIQIPNNLSITRVMSQVSTNYTSNSATSPVMANSNKTMNIIANAPWMSNNVPMSSVSHISPHFFSSNLMDDASKKKRGRPRKNNYEGFSNKIKGPKSKSDEDKDMYDFETEEDESKPVQPLRPRRQNAQPITYKDPDSDEDATKRASQTQPLIQTTQGFRQVHDKALGLNQVDGFGHNPILQENSNEEGDNQEDTDKDEKNVSYTCSEIEETPKGGIKLKIKIKKSASPAPTDPEPPVKKPKTESYDEMQEFPKEEPSIMSTMSEMQRLASGRSSSIDDSRVLKSPVKSPHQTINMNANSPLTMSRMMKPGIPGGGEPKNQTPPHMSQNPHGTMRPNGSNNNPVPVSNSPATSDDTSRGPYPKVHNPYAMQNNFPSQSQGSHPNNPNNFEMQQNFPQGNFGEPNNYNSNLSYNNYMEQPQSQMPMFNRQYQQHMHAFRPGMAERGPAPGMPMKPGFMNPRYPYHNQPSHMSEMDPMSRMNMSRMPGMNNMDARMNPNMNPGMNPNMNPGMTPHPGMMGSMMPGMGAHMSGPGYPSNAMGGGMGPMPTNSNPSSLGHGPSIPSSPIMNSSVMNTMSGGVMPPSMSPGSMQSIMQPSRSPQSIPMNDRQLFPTNQYRMSSPQYQNQGHPNYNNSPTYPGTPNSQGYPRPPTPSYPKPPTPGGGYPQPPTPQNYGKPPTPQNSTIQNPLTPGSYQNPTTPVSYQNPTTPGSYQNPTTPVSNQNPLTPSSHQNPLTPQPQDQSGQAIPSATLPSQAPEKNSQPVIQQNPLNVNNSFSQPKSDSVIQSASVPNIFKDGSKITTPMLSPPSSSISTSSLRKIRRPSKSVTPGTVSPNQKNLSPNQSKECIKSEPDPLIEPKKEPECDSPPDIPPENERIQEPTSIKSEQSPKPIVPKEEKADTPPPESPPPPPPPAKTPDPPKEQKWGEDGEDGMPERALKRIFSYVCHDSGCLPFLPNAMRVCKLWSKVAVDPTLWTHANLGGNIKEKLRTEKKLEWILKNKFPHAIDVDVRNWRAAISSPALKIIAANCPKLTGLGLSSCIKLNYEDVRIIPSLFPNLERIDLSSVSPSTASSRSAASSTCLSDMITTIGEKLTHFSMSNNKMAGLPFVFKAISQHSKNLRVLDVSNISTTSRDTILINIEKLQKGCPMLTKFRTTNTMLGLTDVPVREQMASPGFPYLEELTIGVDQRGYFDGMDDQQIERILKKSDKLKVLDIRGCKGISDSTLVRLPCWDIEYLYVAGCSVTSSSRDGLELLVKKWCRTLLDLDIGNTTDARTVDWAVMALVENEEYIRLRTLNLNGTGVSLKSLTKLLDCCSTLESLNLTSCRALPRGMKRFYHNKEDVDGLRKDIKDGKFDPKDAGSDDDD